MNKGSILKRFLYFLLAFLILIIDQVPTIYLGVKDIRLVCLLFYLASYERRSSFLRKTSWAFRRL